jgi:hypothetical protein
MPAPRLPRVLGALVVVACLAVGCLPEGTRVPASFVALLRSRGLAFEPGDPPPDVISASEVMRFPGQSEPPVYGVLSCLQPPCSIFVRDRGERRPVWLVVFPGPLSDDGRGWALIGAEDGSVIASSK